MVERNYSKPHEVVCVTDNPIGIDPRVRIVPIWNDFADLRSPHGRLQPACYRRLKAFSPEMAETIGPRFVSVDLDVVILGDMSSIWDRDEDFIIWNSPLRKTPYNGSMWMMNAGARKQVYEGFHPITSPERARRAGFQGSDQAWISYILGPDEAVWSKADGVMAWTNDIRRHRFRLPTHSKVVFFQGYVNPWDDFAVKHAPWILDHYR
jgi:hypothetical protein